MANARTEPDGKQSIQREQAKKPYEKPSFRFERVFETTALSCGKVHPHQSSCHAARKAS